MISKCAHAEALDVEKEIGSLGWKKIHETKKSIWFEKSGFSINFNGEDHTKIDMIFEPLLAGSNLVLLSSSSAIMHERFSSNFRNFPKKLSKEGKQQHFGVGAKFEDRASAIRVLKKIQFPELI